MKELNIPLHFKYNIHAIQTGYIVVISEENDNWKLIRYKTTSFYAAKQYLQRELQRLQKTNLYTIYTGKNDWIEYSVYPNQNLINYIKAKVI